jgi:hypothetical protein
VDWIRQDRDRWPGCCECGDEPSGSCATELVNLSMSVSIPVFRVVTLRGLRRQAPAFRSKTVFISTVEDVSGMFLFS